MTPNDAPKGVELLACPFCGGEPYACPRTCDRNSPYCDHDRAYPIVRCRECGAQTDGENWSGVGTAIAAWNRRANVEASVAELRVEVERLAALAEKRRILLAEVTGAGMADRARAERLAEALREALPIVEWAEDTAYGEFSDSAMSTRCEKLAATIRALTTTAQPGETE